MYRNGFALRASDVFSTEDPRALPISDVGESHFEQHFGLRARNGAAASSFDPNFRLEQISREGSPMPLPMAPTSSWLPSHAQPQVQSLPASSLPAQESRLNGSPRSRHHPAQHPPSTAAPAAMTAHASDLEALQIATSALEERVRAFEHEKGVTPPARTAPSNSFSGYTMAIIDLVTRMTSYMFEVTSILFTPPHPLSLIFFLAISFSTTSPWPPLCDFSQPQAEHQHRQDRAARATMETRMQDAERELASVRGVCD